MARRSGPSPAGPLVGLRVLDFGTYIAGSFAALLMGELGADVIKVEPLTGDPAREVGPYLNGESRFFLSLNRNKRGLAIDLRSEPSREVVRALVKRSDVVITNFRHGVTDKLKLDYLTLRDINPRLIYLAASAFGPTGPLRHRPAFDGILQAMGGIAHGALRTAGKITHAPVLLVDFATATLSFGAIMAALYHRQKTGEGQKVETSLLQSVMMLQTFWYCEALETEEEGAYGGFPYRIFETKDGHLFVGSAQNKFWPLLCEAVGAPELGGHADFQTNIDRVQHAEQLTARLEPCFRAKTTAEWEEVLAQTGVPCGPVLTPQEFFTHPQVEAMGMNPILEHSTVGPMRVFGVPFNLKKTPGRIQRHAPTLGEHTGEILREAGFDDTRIAEFQRQAVIRSPSGS